MSMSVNWDVVEGARVRSTPNGIEIRRPVLVQDIPIDCSMAGTDPSVLMKALDVLPLRWTLHPDPRYPIPLQDYEVDSIKSVSAVVVALIYRQQAGSTNFPTDPKIWNREVKTNSYTVETNSTAGGAASIDVFYKTGSGDSISGDVGTYNHRIGHAREHRGFKTYRFSGLMKEWDWWTNWGQNLEQYEFYINSKQWGNKPRGTMLYMGTSVSTPISLTQSIVAISTVECLFMEDKKGHFPLLAYFNERREHPNDAITEANLRAFVLPAVGALTRGNGKTLASIYKEVDFNGKFPFLPQPELPT